MEIKPIRTEEEHQTALTHIESLWDSKSGSAEFDHLEVLATLVDDYENKHHPILPPDPIEAIKFRMDQLQISRKDLEKIIGSRGRVSEVLNRKRKLSLNMIRRLHTNLNIPAEILISDF